MSSKPKDATKGKQVILFPDVGTPPLTILSEQPPGGGKVVWEKAVQGSVWLRGLSVGYFYDQFPLEIET